MPTKVKICGLKTEAALEAALAGGADYVGFVFFPPSPRNVAPATAKLLAARARGRAKVVALMVDPDDALIDEVVAAVAPDILQLHGQETPERVAEVRARWGIPVMKAIPVETADDARAARRFSPRRRPHPVRCPRARRQHAPRRQRRTVRLATAAGDRGRGAVRAVRRAHAGQCGRGHPPHRRGIVDVSSGVESRPGEKDPDLIAPLPSRGKGGITSSPRRVEDTPPA